MIAACPRCQAKYRVTLEQMGSDGVRLRCSKCDAVFRVRAPGQPAPTPIPVPTPTATATPAPAPTPGKVTDSAGYLERPTPPMSSVQAVQSQSIPPQPTPGPPAASAGAPLVLVADPEVDHGKRLVNSLAAWGIQTVLVHDGVEAMLEIQRMLPRAVVLDAALPKMYGYQVCEVVKRNESLRETKVILVGAINDADRYHRPPDDLYGADAYVEKPQLMSELPGLLRGFGLGPSAPTPEPTQGATPTPSAASAPTPTSAPSPASAPRTEATQPSAPPEPVAGTDPEAAAGDGLDRERANAERLARIIVSDLVLYHPSEFQEGLRSGNVAGALDAVLEDGRTLFRQRIDERVRGERDYLVEELERVARSRSGG